MKELIFGAILLLLANHIYGANNIQLFESKEKMHTHILNHIPIGSNIKKGVRLLEKSNFTCHWSDQKLYTGDKVSMLVNCFHTANPEKPSEKYWQITLIHNHNLIEYIEVVYEATIKQEGTRYTINNNTKTSSIVRDKGSITFNNSKQFTLSEFLFSLKRHLEEFENIKLFFKVEDIPHSTIGEYKNVTLNELMTDIDQKNLIKIERKHDIITIVKEW